MDGACLQPSLNGQVDVYKEILSLEMRESDERPAEEDNQLFKQVCDQLRCRLLFLNDFSVLIISVLVSAYYRGLKSYLGRLK